MAEKGEPKRSGHIKIKAVVGPPMSVEDWILANNAFYDPENLKTEVFRYINWADEMALAAYARNRLPARAGTYHRFPGGEWVFGAPLPGYPGPYESTVHFKIGEAAAERNTEIGFATAITREAFLLRSELSAVHAELWVSLARLSRLATFAHQFQVEFDLESPLGAGLKLKRKGRDGGETGGAQRRAKGTRQRATWQAAADRIQKKSPKLKNKAEIARRVQQIVDGNIDTIRRNIRLRTD